MRSKRPHEEIIAEAKELIGAALEPVRAGWSKLQELNHERNAAERQIAAVLEGQAARKSLRRQERTRRARALLGDETAAAEPEIATDVQALYERRAEIAEAIELQRLVIGEIKDRVAREVGPKLRRLQLELHRSTLPVVAALTECADAGYLFRSVLNDSDLPLTHFVPQCPVDGFRLDTVEVGDESRVIVWYRDLERDYPELQTPIPTKHRRDGEAAA